MIKNLPRFFFLLTIVLSFLACDKCKDISCENGGECKEGKCDCPEGYSGDQCETKDPCLGINCLNGGTCSSGTCNCPADFYGSNCEYSCAGCTTFSGNYTSYHQYCNQILTYDCSISILTNGSNKLSINNFSNKGWNVVANVSGNSFTIAPQIFTDATTGKSWKIETTASASLSGNTLTIPVKFTDQATLNIINCISYKLFK